MDADTMFSEFLSAVSTGDTDTAFTRAVAICAALEDAETLPTELAWIETELADCRDSIFPVSDGFDSIEFRIYIRPEGMVELCTGDSCYDIDHRGECGAGSVSASDTAEDIRAAIVQAFNDATDSMVW
jgi:hypothetical protein